ncbi:hypothetical protein CgunFtcFv8_007891 [Champsocephalus gunnari]|uniref:Uncharacterized protein n=1 Tax=Champsocephalus gunnari TaxID=52237 RepID=A0AAN8D439_CHAGU|nr:hypothetical protein CgunFtcFv8_007891 [Champsocephalus gunnari]
MRLIGTQRPRNDAHKEPNTQRLQPLHPHRPSALLCRVDAAPSPNPVRPSVRPSQAQTHTLHPGTQPPPPACVSSAASLTSQMKILSGINPWSARLCSLPLGHLPPDVAARRERNK